MVIHFNFNIRPIFCEGLPCCGPILWFSISYLNHKCSINGVGVGFSLFLSNNSTTSKVLVALLISIFLIGGGACCAKILDDAFVNGEKVLIYGVGEVAVRTMASLVERWAILFSSWTMEWALSGFELHGVPVISSAHLEEDFSWGGVDCYHCKPRFSRRKINS